jgi:DNA-binding IclR family transcriptional regulator
MLECLAKMPDHEILTLRELSKRLDRNDSNTRRILLAMRDLGMVEEVPIPSKTGIKMRVKGWKKLVRPCVVSI